MLTISQETFDCVVERADPGRQPERHRRGQRQLRVVDHAVEQEADVAHPGLVPAHIGEAGAETELRNRKSGRDGDVRQSAIGETAPIRELDGNDLRGIDRAPAAEAHEAVDGRFRGVLDRGLYLRERCMLGDHLGGRRLGIAERGANTGDQLALGQQGAGGDQTDPVYLQPLELRTQLGQRTRAPVDRAGVRVLEVPCHCAVIVRT